MNDDEFHDYRDDYHDYSQLADASGAADYSHPADHSAGSGKPSAPDMNPVNKYLQGREQAGAQSGLNKMGGGNVAKAENSGGSANPMNFSPGQSSGGRFDMKANVKKRIIGWLVAGGLGLGGLGLGLGGLSMLISNFANVMKDKFATASQVMARKTKAFFKCALSKECRANVKAVKWTKAAWNSLRGNGAKVKVKGTNTEINDPDKAPPTEDLEIDTGNGAVTSGNVEDLLETNPAAQGALEDSTPAANADRLTHADGDYQNVENRLMISQESNEKQQKDNPVDDDDAKAQQKKDMDNGTTDPDVVGTDGVDGAKPDTAPSAQNKNTLDVANNGSKVAPSINKKAASGTDANADFEAERAKVKDTGEKEVDKVAENLGTKKSSVLSKIQEFVNIFTPLNVMCGLNNGLSTINKAAKLYKAVQLAGFAMQFMKADSEIRGPGGDGGDGPSADNISRLGGAMTATQTATADSPDGAIKKGDTTLASATDSFGYKFAAYGDLDDNAKTSYTTLFSISGLTGIFGGVYNVLHTFMKDTVGVVANMIARTGPLAKAINEAIAASPDIAFSGDITTTNGLCELINSNGSQAVQDALSVATTFFTGGAATLSLDGVKAALSKFLETGIVDAVKSKIASLLTKEAMIASLKKLGIMVTGVAVTTAVTEALFDWASNTAINAIKEKFLDTMPVGSQAGDAITSGYAYSEAQNCQLGGCAPLTTGQAQTQIADAQEYQAGQSRVAMATDPWNIRDNHTAVGNFLGSFVANIYSNGNSPLGMTQSLLGMFGTALGDFARGVGGKAYAAASSLDGYTDQCDDPDANSIAPDGQKMALDPFCNQLYGMPSTSDMDIQTVYSQMSQYVDDQGNIKDENSTYGKFLANCVNRGTPLGTTDTVVNDPGTNCLLSDSGGYDGQGNKLFYNYVQYQRVADGFSQGSNLGCEADGSCSSDDSSASSSASGGAIATGSAQDLAKTLLSNPNLSGQNGNITTDLQSIASTGNVTACGVHAANPKMLGLLVTLLQTWKIKLSTITTGHPCDAYDHPKGSAFDLVMAQQVSGGSCTAGGAVGAGSNLYGSGAACMRTFAQSLSNIAKQSGITIAANQLGYCFSQNGGGVDIGSGTLPGVNTGVQDTCNHLHIGVPK